jgi:outer membrane protein TolC
VSQARLLFVRLTQQQGLMRILEQTRALFADRYARLQTALDRGLVTLSVVTPHLTALQDVIRQINDLERQIAVNRHDLNALLGLSPDVAVPLVGPVGLPDLDDARIEALLPDLPRRRPDLIALQAGYAAQELRIRAAILAQFPSLSIGVTRARDTSDVNTAGVGISVSLPLFSGNRGPIAVERATRHALFTDYQERLNAADSGIRRILAEQRLNQRQLQEVDQGVAELTQAAVKTEAAFTSRDIDALTYTTMQTAVLAKQIERITLEQSMLEQRVALQTLVGGQLPVRP